MRDPDAWMREERERMAAGWCPVGPGHVFRVQDDSPAGPRAVARCECGYQRREGRTR